MQISKSLKRLIYWELGIPLTFLTIGIYHGLMQTIYRAGVIHQSSFAHLDYYQGLTLHGVINAIVLTSFFAVAFGHATIAFYLKKRTTQMGSLAEFLADDRRNADGCLGDAVRESFCTVYFLSAAKSPSFVLPGCSVADRWFLGSAFQLGKYVCELEKRKS